MSADPEPEATARAAHRVLAIGTRIAGAPSERLVETVFRRELDAQVGLFAAISLADLAHTLAMIQVGVIPADQGRALLDALLALQAVPDDFSAHPALGDLYTNREAWLSERTPATGWLGIGRARREATTTAFSMTLRAGLLDLAEAVTGLGLTLVERAGHWHSAWMPDYTYLQAAQPTSFGHYLSGFVAPLLRDCDRLRALYARVNRSPAGGGSTNGSWLPLPRERLAELLGFEGLVVHARDAMWQADLPIETAALLMTTLINLDRLSEDLQIFATEEFALVELDDRHARASKIMPQKKNPFALTHIRGAANAMIGTLTATAASARTPSGQPDNRLTIYGSIPRAIADTRDVVLLMDEVMAGLRCDTDRGRARLDQGNAAATDLAELLVRECGLDFRQAHGLVGTVIRTFGGARPLASISAEELAAGAAETLGHRIAVTPAMLAQVFDPEQAVHARQGVGGAAPAALDAMLGGQRRALEHARTWTVDQRERLGSAEQSLLQQCRQACRA